MTTTRTGGTVEAGEGTHQARLRPADASSRQPAAQSAGPFEVAARKGAGMRGALMTGVLVLYPAFATVVAIIAGLFLTGAGA